VDRFVEIGDDSYTKRFGGSRVTRSDVLHVQEGNPRATFVGDLASAEHIPSDAFDCIILTQTLNLIYDMKAAMRTLYRILKPGGVLLATVPGISQIETGPWKDTWYWSLTILSARRMAEEEFPADRVEVESHGNVLAATAFLMGLAAEELDWRELEHQDPFYQLLITLRAAKPQSAF
jgi:SAM-dependent methyltransferase